MPVDGYYSGAGDQGNGVCVYMLDTGVDTTHPDLQGRSFHAFDAFLEDSANPDSGRVCTTAEMTCTNCSCAVDTHGHGTFVAGVIGSLTYGVAKRVQTYAVKVVDDNGDGNTVELTKGLRYVGNVIAPSFCTHTVNGVAGVTSKVATISVQFDGRWRSVQIMIEWTIERGVFVAVAAGDTGFHTFPRGQACAYSPGFVERAFVVGATTRDDYAAWWSNSGSCVDLWAPGKDIQSLAIGSGTAHRSGTAIASAFVAGVVALVMGDNPGFPHALIESVIKCRAATGRLREAPPNSVADILHMRTLAGITDPDCVSTTTTTTTTTPPWAADITSPTTSPPAATTINPIGGQSTDAGLCFPGDAQVGVPGGIAHLSTLRPGDMVLVERDSGEFVYEPLLSFMHAMKGSGVFHVVRHSLGELRATSNHMVFVVDDGKRIDKAFRSLRVGDQLLVNDGGEIKTSEVFSIQRTVSDSGMFGPLTPSGKLVVDGVVVSSYAEHSNIAVPHSLGHAVLFPQRLFYRLFGNGMFDWAKSAPETQEVEAFSPLMEFLIQDLRLPRIHEFLASI